MNFLLPLLAVFALLPSVRAADQIEISTQFVEADAAVALPHDIAALVKMDGVDFSSGPRVTTKVDQQAGISMMKEMPLPAFGFSTPGDKVETGLAVSAIARFEGVNIVYRARVTSCDLATSPPNGTQWETASHDLYASGTIKDSETVWLRVPAQRKHRQRFVLLTFTRQGT